MASSDIKDNPENREINQLISSTIDKLSRLMPWECKCLVQAISGKKILDTRKIQSTLYFGVARNVNGELIAHAWLRSGDMILTGNSDMEQYTIVATFS